MKKNMTAWAIFFLTFALGVLAFVFYKSTKDTAVKFQESVTAAANGTSGVNALATSVNNILGSIGLGK